MSRRFASPSLGSAPAARPRRALIGEAARAAHAAQLQCPDDGLASLGFVSLAAEIAHHISPSTILDYGAGRGTFADTLSRRLDRPVPITRYDPAVVECVGPPAPHDMVLCIDVLAFVEPDRIEAVLDDLSRVTLGVGLFTIATREALWTLPDGRNAHLIQQGPQWWLPKLFERFQLRSFTDEGRAFWVLVHPREDA